MLREKNLTQDSNSRPKRVFIYLNLRCRAAHDESSLVSPDGNGSKDTTKQTENKATLYYLVFPDVHSVHGAGSNSERSQPPGARPANVYYTNAGITTPLVRGTTQNNETVLSLL